MNRQLTSNYRRWLWVTLITVLALRLFTLDAYPFLDTTEARYGEMARKMVETQNWVTPQFDYDVPFWGKPPLATWLSAGSYQLFGVTEFAARLPSLILAMLMLALVYYLGKHQHSSDLGLVAATVLASNILFFVAAGAVIMDTALVTGITLAMVAFWQAMHNGRRSWGYVFFIGISIGLLSKGPLTLVLVFVPISLWVFWQGNTRQVLQRIPWISGSLLMLGLSLPWYILAELRTPGFLDYFIVGEHWKRFIISGWQGDLYGSAHARPRGTIWLYTLAAFLPWSLILPVLAWRIPSHSRGLILRDYSWSGYLGLWAITPILFFTLSGNILATYALPAMIPLSLIGAQIWLFAHATKTTETGRYKTGLKLLPYFALITPLISLTAIGLQNNGYIGTKSQRDLLSSYYQLQADSESRLIYLLKRPFSAQFYSRGQALVAKNWRQALPYLDDDTKDFYVIRSMQLQTLPDGWQDRLSILDEFHGYSLMVEKKNNTENQELKPTKSG